MTRMVGFMLVLLISLACTTSGLTNQSPVGDKNAAEEQEPPVAARVQQFQIGDSAGVVVLNDHRGDKRDLIRLYNEDGSLWYEFSFYDDEASVHRPSDFRPFAFKQDYFVLALRCVGRRGARWEVVVNEETGAKKYVRTDDSFLKFETWEEHIPQRFAVDFNRDNHLLETPGGRVKSINFPKDVSFHPVEVKGEWLKVRWGGSGQAGDQNAGENFGWIRWKEDGCMLIELFYFA